MIFSEFSVNNFGSIHRKKICRIYGCKRGQKFLYLNYPSTKYNRWRCVRQKTRMFNETNVIYWNVV